MLHIAIGHSADIDLDRAVMEVVQQARAGLKGNVADAGILFVADGLNHVAALAGTRNAFPATRIIGCTTAGEASPALGYEEDSILLILFASPDVRFATAIGRATSKDATRAADGAFEQLRHQLGDAQPRLCFMLSDAMRSDPEVAVRRLTERFGSPLPIVGGAAASYPPGGPAHLFFDGEILDDGFVVLALAGAVDVSVATETSWRPIGKPGRVTAAEGSTIYRIDDAPALDFYRRLLGEEAYVFVGNPLAILDRDGAYKIRSPMTFDPETSSIDVVGGVAVGDTVQLAFATVDDIRGGASDVIGRTLEDFPDGRDPALVFFCSCAARKMFLALDTREEFEELRGGIDADVPVLGFYGYGEIGSAATGAPPRFHNQAIVSVALG